MIPILGDDEKPQDAQIESRTPVTLAEAEAAETPFDEQQFNGAHFSTQDTKDPLFVSRSPHIQPNHLQPNLNSNVASNITALV